MKKITIIGVLLALILSSCEKKEWEQSNLSHVPVITLTGNIENDMDSLDIYYQQNFIIQFRNKGAKLIKDSLLYFNESFHLDEEYYTLNFTFLEKNGYSYSIKEEGDNNTYTTDRLVQYAFECDIKPEPDKPVDYESINNVSFKNGFIDIVYLYVSLEGDTIEIDTDYIDDINIKRQKRLY